MGRPRSDAIIANNGDKEVNYPDPDDETQDNYAVVKEAKESFGY